MGCPISRRRESSKSIRVARWKSTGIIALRDSKLKAIPKEIFDMDGAVRALDLTQNRIVDVPEKISTLINIQRLIFVDNRIMCLPMSLVKFHSLKILKLDSNQITSLPEELGLLIQLEDLSVSKNLLTSLPESIGSLCHLMLLNVSMNKLKCLPESIGSCFSLEKLQANDNFIKCLPLSVCSLASLKSLSLNNNSMQELPPNFLRDCRVLQHISLRGNPISMDQFQQMEDFQTFEARRKKKFDKQIDCSVMIDSNGLDEGIDL